MAMILTNLNNKGVEFVQVFGSTLGGKSSLDREADFFVRCVFGRDLMPSEESFCIGVHDEDGIVAGVKNNGISGFGANAVEGEKLLPEFLDLGGGS